MDEVSVPVPPDLTGPKLADWAEVIMFLEGRALLSRAALRDRMYDATLGSLDDDDSGESDEAEDAEGSDEDDSAADLDSSDDFDRSVEFLLAEVDFRAGIPDTTYPFHRTEQGLARRNWNDPDAYEFLLWLSVSDHYRASLPRKDDPRFADTEHLFNAVVKHALMRYLGQGSEAIEFAASGIDGRPSHFRDAVYWLAEKLGLPAGGDVPPYQYNDGGVDVVAWHSFGDRAVGGFLVVLCQCTVGRKWERKPRDISPNLWGGWILFGSEPLTALAIPFRIPEPFHNWSDVRSRANLVLDRYRLTVVASTGEEHPEADSIREWCEKERNLLIGEPEAVSFE